MNAAVQQFDEQNQTYASRNAGKEAGDDHLGPLRLCRTARRRRPLDDFEPFSLPAFLQKLAGRRFSHFGLCIALLRLEPLVFARQLAQSDVHLGRLQDALFDLRDLLLHSRATCFQSA